MIGERLAIERDLTKRRNGSSRADEEHGSDNGGRPQRVVARHYRERDAAVRRFLAAADLLGVITALAGAMLVASQEPTEFAWGLALLPAWVVIFKAYGLYDRDLKRISHRTVDDLPWIFHAVLIGSLLLLAYYQLLPVHGIQLRLVAIFGVIAMLAVPVLRAVARRLAVSVLSPEPVVLIGNAPEIATLAAKLRAHSEYGVEPVGPISLSASDSGERNLTLEEVGDLELDDVVNRDGAERIVVAGRTSRRSHCSTSSAWRASTG